MTPSTPTLNSDDNLNYNTDIEPQQIIRVPRFILLCICTFGAYQLWWIYKAYRFFAQKEGTFSNAAIKACFNIIFLIPLLNKILNFAKQKGYQRTYYAIPIYILLMSVSIISLLPLPFIFLLTTMSGSLLLIQPLLAFNYAIKASPDVRSYSNTSLSGRQIVLVSIGGLLIFMTIAGAVLMFLSGEMKA